MTANVWRLSADYLTREHAPAMELEASPAETVGLWLYPGGWIADLGEGRFYTILERDELYGSREDLEESLYTYLYL